MTGLPAEVPVTTLIRQVHEYGCGLASLAMISGWTYDEVRDWLVANWPAGSQTPGEWLEQRGIHKGIADYFLAENGYAWRTVYAGWGQKPWPPEPFAPVHLAQVVQPSGNSHYVVMRSDGVVLDPLSDEPKRLTDWSVVNNVQGVWRPQALVVSQRDEVEREVRRRIAREIEKLPTSWNGEVDAYGRGWADAAVLTMRVAAAIARGTVIYSKDVAPGETFRYGDGVIARSIEERPTESGS